jgi:hypothetical protein
MERLLNQLGSAVTVLCAGSCACVVGLFIFGGLLIRFAGANLIPMVGDLLVGRADTSPEKSKRTPAVLTRPAGGAVLKTQAQSLDFDEALRRQGGVPTIQAQSAGYPQAQAPYPQQGYANTAYTAQASAPYSPALQNIPPMAAPQMPATNIQPLYDNRVLPGQPMQAQSAPNQPYPAAAPYPPLQGAPMTPSLSGQMPTSPAYQPLSGGYQATGTPSLSQNVDPNAFFPAPTGGIPRRASLSAPRDVSMNTNTQPGFDTENYPGLRSRNTRRRVEGQSTASDQDQDTRGGIEGVIGNLGNFLGL